MNHTAMYNCHNCSRGQLLGGTGSKCMICGHIVCSQCRKLKALSQALLDMHISDDTTSLKKTAKMPQPIVLDDHVNKLEGGARTAVSRMKANELQIQRGLLLDMHVSGIEQRPETKGAKVASMGWAGGTSGRH